MGCGLTAGSPCFQDIGMDGIGVGLGLDPSEIRMFPAGFAFGNVFGIGIPGLGILPAGNVSERLFLVGCGLTAGSPGFHGIGMGLGCD